MATRQKDKDIVNFSKKLKKRYPDDATVLSREHKVLEHLVFAIFLENATFEQARSSFNKLERYFIDWNEVRVSKANEIANVIGNVPNAFKIGERLRRLLQWIFDKTFKFDLEDVRAKGVEETLSFLKSVPFSTRFMNEYVSLCGFGTKVFPMDEGVLRAFRLLGWVKVCDEQEVVPTLDLVSDDADFLKLFFAAHTLGSELMDETTQKGAIEFLTTVDPGVAKRSFEPLVESTLPTDPSEIAKLFAKRERRPKNVSASAMMNAMFGDETMDSDDMDSDDIDESDDFEKDGFEKDGFEKDGDKGGFGSYDEESDGGAASSDGFAARKGTQDSAYSSGKRAETTLSKDGASYFESALDTAEQDEFDESRVFCSERDVKPRKRAKGVADVPETSRKSVRVVASRSKKDGSRLNSKSNSTADDVAVVSASNEKKSREKKSNELNAAYEVESKPDGVEKAKKAEVKKTEVKKAEVKKVEVKKAEPKKAEAKKAETQKAETKKAEVKKAETKKAARTAKSKEESVVSKSDAESVKEANEKKSVASSASVSKKGSVDEGVKKEQKKSVKASKEEPKVSKSFLLASVERVKSRAKSKEQSAVEDADARPRRKRASTPPKEEPPATRSKKG